MASTIRPYSVGRISKRVDYDTFKEFVNNYPRDLIVNFDHGRTRTVILYNDYKLAPDLDFSAIAETYVYYYDENIPRSEREYYIVINHEDLYNSKVEDDR